MDNEPTTHEVDTLSSELANMSLIERLLVLSNSGKNPTFTTSLGLEDQVLTAAIAIAAVPVRIVTLDTGRLFDETVELISQTEKRFDINIQRFHPDPAGLKTYIDQHGLNGFYDSRAARLACCAIRKVEPLSRALADADIWITGLRRSQSDARAAVPFATIDAAHGVIKTNPLADWTTQDLKDFVEANNVPVNPLHDRGYPSIGCEPCTRAIKPGEDERAGRWWWERDETRECGLHVASPEREMVLEPGQ